MPAPGITAFTAGDFDASELPRGADEASEKTEHDGALSQSFLAEATSAEPIMDVFERSLPADGWEVAEPVTARGTDSPAGASTKDGRRLEVSAVLAQGVETSGPSTASCCYRGSSGGEGVEGG